MRDAAFGKRIAHRVHHSGHGPDGSKLAASFDAEKIRPARNALLECVDHWRHLVCTRHAVIHERPGQELPALLVVDGLLVQRLPRTLRHAALNLPFYDHVVDDASDIVAAHHARQAYRAGIGLDLDFADL